MSALSQVIDHLDESTIRTMILPKTKQLFDINADTKVCSFLFSFFVAVRCTFTGSFICNCQPSVYFYFLPFPSDYQIQINILICIEKVIGDLDKTDILDDVLPIIMRARIHDASVLIIVISMRASYRYWCLCWHSLSGRYLQADDDGYQKVWPDCKYSGY